MKELEEVNCEIRRIVNLQFPVPNRSRNSEAVEHGHSAITQEHDNVNDCRGGFLHNATYAWLSYNNHLVVFNVKIGESISSWTFRGVVTSVSQFPAQAGEFPLLLVGVDNCASKLKDSSGLLCIFDCTTSRVLRAIRMPCGIEQACVVSGGAAWEEFNDKRPDNILNEMDGMACVVLRNLQHIMIDLRRSTWDVHDLSVMDEMSPAEINLSAKQVTGRCQSNRERHTAYNLLNSRIEKHIGFNRQDFESSSLLGENLTTAIISSTKIGCLISGCLGRVIIWQNDASIGWISAPIDENMTVTHLALLEPTDDPRPFYYLWVVFQDELFRTPPLLRMYAMLFERKYCDREMNLYFNLEDNPSLKFELELNEGDKVISLCTIERESNPEQTDSGSRRGEESLLLVATNERVLLFDLNQWYKEQMPHTISECQNPNSILATYFTRSDVQNADSQIISSTYVPSSLQEFPSNGPSSPEELFHPNSLSFEWIELSSNKLSFWMTRGIQADLLREMAMAGPVILIQPSETFHRCLSVGLVPFNSEFSFSSDQNTQREMLLSLCLEQRWSTFLVKCAVEWSDGSVSYLYPTFLNWGIQRASTIKMIADRLCVPLFDQSGSSIGEADVKTLRFCSQQLECLSSVVGKLPSVTADLMKQRRTLRRVSTYFQVLLWFYDVGLLPETQDFEEEEEGALPISLALKVPYPYEKLSALYRKRRAQFQKDNIVGQNLREKHLFIDELITRECSTLKTQWEREGGVAMDGCYPPPSLQSLLRSYLTDCDQAEGNEINCKHQITIYLLMDLAMLLQQQYPAVKQLIKYPSAFKMSPSLIKLTQAFWLLDHEDYQEFLDTMTGQLVCDSDVKDWHHRLILRTLIRNNHHKLALVYLRVRKPPLSSLKEQGMTMSLSVEHGLVQSAFHHRPPYHYEELLTCFFHACKKHGKLNEILHLALDTEEEEIFIRFLEENKTEDVRLLYYLQRCRYTEAISGHSIWQYQSNFTRDIQSTSHSMLGAYNMTLPDITKKFSTSAAAINLDADLKARYSRPMSHCKSHDRMRNIYETVITKARETHLRGDKCQIPFVSAPCTSLKLNNYGTNSSCVLFPNRKRSVDQLYEGENVNDPSNGAKRQKLSSSVSPNKDSSKESRLTAAFETPLVKPKLNASTNKSNVPETPQSILKIKRSDKDIGFTKSSQFPSTATFQTTEITDELFEGEKKINRQIRFNIHQSKRTLMYEEEEEQEVEEERKEEKEKEKEIDGRNKIDAPLSANASNVSTVASNKSPYYESAVLDDNSGSPSKIYCYARPRPSLRRSALQTSVELLQDSCAKKANDSSANVLTSSTCEKINNPLLESNRRSSLMSASAYTTSAVLSSDSNVDMSYPRYLDRSSLQWELSERKDNKCKSMVSSTPFTKKIVSRMFQDNRATVIENDGKEEDVDKFFASDARKIENLDTQNESKRPSHIELSDDRSDLMEQRDDVERDMRSKSRQGEGKCNNGDIARRESPDLQGSYEEEEPVLFESEKVAESNLSVLSESDEELLRLQVDEEDSDEYGYEDVFESVEESVPVSLSSDMQNFGCNVDERGIVRSNGLQESLRMMDNVDLTDDESVSSRDVTSMVPDEMNDEWERLMSTVRSENKLYDMLNITDDESDINIRESEGPKVKGGKFSNLQECHVTRNVEVEKNGESNEASRDRRDSIPRKEVGIILSQTDVEDDEPKNPDCRADNNRMEDSEESNVFQEKILEVESSSRNNKRQVESKDISSVRTTKSRRANSAAKDVTKDASLQQMESRRVTRLKRSSSITNDATTSSSSLQNIDIEFTQSQRTRSKSKLTDSPSRSLSSEKPPLLRRFDSISSSSTNTLSQEIDSDKAPSLTKEMSSLSRESRRRDSSLVKEMNSVATSRDISPVVLLELIDTDAQLSTGRYRRSTSTAKEIPSIENKGNDSESAKNDTPMRRSTRLKELQTAAPKNLARSMSASSLVILTSDDEGDKSARKGSSRVRKSSVSSDTDKATTSGRLLRSSSRDLDKTKSEEMPIELECKTRRKRGSSVPKEMTLQIGKRCKSSLIKETIPERDEPPEESRMLRSSIVRKEEQEESVVNRQTRSTRNRRASVLSVPEELEEILSPSSRGTRSNRGKKAARSNVRERRACSADVTYKEVKRRTRNVHVVEPIAEELTEDEDGVKFEGDKVVQSAVSKAPSTVIKTQRKRDRSRKSSASKESSNIFSFSQPEETDVPLNEKDIGEVPSFVFSPPQTRSKNVSSNQQQK